jgi:hypothetical protein
MAPSASTGRSAKMSANWAFCCHAKPRGPAAPAGRAALLYFGSHKLGSQPVPGRWFFPARALPGNRHQFVHAAAGPRTSIAARSALSVEVRDFEEEKSLDERRRGLGGCSRAGRLWHHYLFCGPESAPSGLTNRVLIAIQNPSALPRARCSSWMPITTSAAATTASRIVFHLRVFGRAAHHHPEHARRADRRGLRLRRRQLFADQLCQRSGVGSSVSGLNGLSSSIFITRNQNTYSPPASNLTCADGGQPDYQRRLVSAQPARRLPRERESRRLDALAFVQNSNYVYYPRKLTAAQTIAYSGGPSTWPKAAVDCEPQNAPGWCLFQAQSPDHVDATGKLLRRAADFDRPVKAVFSADGGTAYMLNCGPECGGNKLRSRCCRWRP